MRDAIEFVIKVAGRCNIACTYCYMYELGDASALFGPKLMSRETLTIAAQRIVDYSSLTDADIVVAVHGGEPLMLGVAEFCAFSRQLRDALGDRLTLCVQTNGTLLHEEWIEAFLSVQAVVGVSIDGPHQVNDTYRIDHRGRGTYARALKGYDLLKSSVDRGLRFGGLISVMNPRQSVHEYYEWLKSLRPGSAGLLFPDANYDNYSQHYDFSTEEFSIFLCSLFDLWWDDGDADAPEIRLFKNIVVKILGGHSDSESVGTGNAPAIIIETDGSIEAHDVARMNHGRDPKCLNVEANPISDIFSDVTYMRLNPATPSLCDICQACPVKDICAGGMILHRYSKEHLYDAPSIYCRSLFDICTHAYLKIASSENVQFEEHSGA